MNWPTKRLLQLWFKHFATFSVFVLGLIAIVAFLTIIPDRYMPLLVIAAMLAFGISMSYVFAKADYKREREQGDRVLNTLKKDFT